MPIQSSLSLAKDIPVISLGGKINNHHAASNDCNLVNDWFTNKHNYEPGPLNTESITAIYNPNDLPEKLHLLQQEELKD